MPRPSPRASPRRRCARPPPSTTPSSRSSNYHMTPCGPAFHRAPPCSISARAPTRLQRRLPTGIARNWSATPRSLDRNILIDCIYGLSSAGAQPMAAPPAPLHGFPKDFRWGTATSAYQVEGATTEDGRGASIWDTFAATPGKIADGTNGLVAVDHYHRYKEDVAQMKGLGATAYRFSIAWPRVFPDGTGTPNPKGLAFYDRLLDELLANGIEPYATLYHWDLPQALQDRGGWEQRETAQAFGDYSGYVAAKLGDRVKHFFTLNETSAFVGLGYGNGVWAPGLNLPAGRLNQVRHHAVLGHGLAVQAIRASGKAGIEVGIADNIINAVPAVETPANIVAAARALRELNAAYLTVIMEGRYTDAYLAEAGPDAPKFTPEDLKTISSPLDFVGLNVYTP